jgi:hypothetical protein
VNTAQTEDFSAYEADAAPTPAQAENVLARITAAAASAVEAAAAVAAAEAALAEAQKAQKQILERVLPELMDEAQQDELTTAPDALGRRWQVKRGEVLRASIPPANIDAAAAWLGDNDAGAIVKRELKLQYGRGEDQEAARIVSILKEAGADFDEKRFVHPATLAATLKEMLQEGVAVPMQLMGAHVMPFATVKPAKEAGNRVRRAAR